MTLDKPLPPPFIPSYSIPINEIVHLQKIIGLMGVSGSGKTYSALTFPSPIVIDIDGNLSGHIKRTDILVLNFNDNNWIENKLGYKYNKNIVKFPAKDAVLWFLQNDALKITYGQTLVIDSWSTLQDEFDKQRILQPVYTKEGATDEFAFWDDKKDFSRDILNSCKKLKCDVVITFHEQDAREKLGKLNGKIEPLMKGSFNKEMGKYFTEFYRCVVNSKIDDKQNTVGATYKWQTASSGEVASIKTRMTNAPFLIEPNASSIKY